jgi:mersacidin/lichenicidin family type 2 lantibiotic
MRSEKIVRIWKDEDYWLSLSSTEQSLLPEHPSGLIELTDEELSGVDGGATMTQNLTCITLCVPTWDQVVCPWFNRVTTASKSNQQFSV